MEMPDDLTQKQLLEYARDLKRTYDELIAKNNELEALNKKKSDFLDIVAHELRTPITKITELADFLVRGSVSADEREIFLAILKKAISRLDVVLSEIVSANQQGRYDVLYKTEDLRVCDLIKEVASEISQFIKARNQRLKVNLEAENLKIEGNRIRLHDALFNIIQNASKFSPDNKEILVNLKKEQEFCVIEIIDEGIGIAEDKLDAIFNVFYEEQDARKHHSGSFEFMSGRLGMGLYIAKNIIEKYKGRITVESEPGKGSRFSIILPLARSG